MYRSIIIIGISLLAVSGAFPLMGASSEKQYLDLLEKASAARDEKKVYALAKEFFRAYPQSPRIADIRLMMADVESSPEEALKRYRIVIDKYRYYERRDYALYRVCEILYLMSRWSPLRDEARVALREFGTGSYGERFRFFLIQAYIHLEDYDAAEQACQELIDGNHHYQNLSRALLVMAYINKKKSGLSRDYIYNLREIALGFQGSDIRPSLLLLLGEFYEEKKSYNEAFSAYSDLLEWYPGSPEAASAGGRLKDIIRHNPRRVLYIPSKKIVNDTEGIDIRPDIEIPDEIEKISAYYSISIGPFTSLKRAGAIKNLLKGFGNVKTVRLSNGYTLYVSKHDNTESALRTKIRLAEEFGINGRIVRISSDKNRKYIYGE